MEPTPRFAGANASGLARAVVNETGRLIDLEIEPELLRRPAALVAEAVMSAVLDAQEKAAAVGPGAAGDRAGDRASKVELSRIQAMLDEANLEVDRKMAQFATLVQDLSRGLDNRR
ncbi:MAG TPA: YbaB/EbfC family nucleoid-associated protein [Candidatus Limnocylindrales bacterium]|nr:YbaB/EbfC family nucleoid-associated protein [Candidatus Limnocylindrales bacterium]